MTKLSLSFKPNSNSFSNYKVVDQEDCTHLKDTEGSKTWGQYSSIPRVKSTRITIVPRTEPTIIVPLPRATFLKYMLGL